MSRSRLEKALMSMIQHRSAEQITALAATGEGTSAGVELELIAGEMASLKRLGE